MIPYILTAVGGYLIGSSLSTKFANGGDIEEYKKWESRYDMLGELYEDANAEERKNIQKEMDELESKMHKSERNYANGGEIANTILSQLGGARRLNIMTGAYNFVDLGSGLSFKLKNPRANYVKIKLNSMDLYDIEVGRIRGTTYKVIDSANNMYFDQLKPFIEKATGLYLSLKEGGEINEKYQIKRSDGKYLSIGMDGKIKWNESPDLGYIYKKEDAETFSEYLNQKGEEVEVTKYDKDWWKK